MGHKVHPNGFRLGVSRTWNAKWYSDKEYTELLREDIAIRTLVKKRLANARAFADGDPEALEIIEFVESSERGVVSPRGRLSGADELGAERS